MDVSSRCGSYVAAIFGQVLRVGAQVFRSRGIRERSQDGSATRFGNIIITVPPRGWDVVMFESLGFLLVLYIEVRGIRF